MRGRLVGLGWALVGVVGVFWVLAKESAAEDFSPKSWEWNGIARFARVLREQGTIVEQPRKWDWSKARLQDPILILAPQREGLEIRPLLIFLAAGGRVFLADDFGTSRPWMSFFGLEQQRGAYNAWVWQQKRYIDIHVTQPLQTQQADLLLRQSSVLFLNHPQWMNPTFLRPHEALLSSHPHYTNVPDGFRPGLVLFRIPFGYGQLVVFSDPSALINEMIGYGDNLRFARNVAHYLNAPARSGKLVLLAGDFSWAGEPPLSSAQQVWGFLQMFWDVCAEANKVFASEASLHAAYPSLSPASLRMTVRDRPTMKAWSSSPQLGWWCILLALVCGVMWWGWSRFAAGTLPNQEYDREREEVLRLIPERFSEQLGIYREGALSYLWPMIILREEVILFLVEQYHLNERLGQREAREAVVLVLDLLEEDERLGRLDPPLGAVLPRLRTLLMRLPSRHQWNEWLHRNVNAHELRLAYRDVLLCLQQAGLDQKFRQPYLKRPTSPNFASEKIHDVSTPRSLLVRWFVWLFGWLPFGRAK